MISNHNIIHCYASVNVAGETVLESVGISMVYWLISYCMSFVYIFLKLGKLCIQSIEMPHHSATAHV